MGTVFSHTLSLDLLCACVLPLDLVEGSLDEVSGLDVKVAIARVAYGKHHQEIKQLLSVNIVRLLIDSSEHLGDLLQADVLSEADVGDRLQKVAQVGLHFLLGCQPDELVEMALHEVWIQQVLVGLNAQHACLVFNRERRRIDLTQLGQQDVVLQEFWPLLGEVDKLREVFPLKLLDLVLLTVRVIEFLDELLGVIVDRVASQHGQAVHKLVKIHLVEELCEDHAQRAQSVATLHPKQLRSHLEHVPVHFENHALVLQVLFESLLVLSLEQAVLADGHLV